MSDHAILGASKANRWMNCPGSIRMSEGRIDKPSRYADEGTAAHELAARCLKNGTAEPDLFLGVTIQVDDMIHPIVVDEEMVEAVDVFVSYVRKRMDQGFELIGIEQRFDLAPLNPPGPMFGRADVVLYKPQQPATKFPGGVTLGQPAVMEVPDFKYGAGVRVDPTENEQGMFYAIGAILATEKKPHQIDITIVQPRAPHPDGIIRTWSLTWDELVAFRENLIASAVATQQEDAPLVPGDHCRFCPALAICPAQADAAQAAARNTFAVMAIQDELNVPIPEALDMETLRNIMDVSSMFKAWLSAVAEEVVLRTERGEETGYKMVPKRGQRKWNNEAEAEQVLKAVLGNEAYTRKLLSVTQAEKAAKGSGAKIDPALFSMVSSGVKLAPNDDPRQAIAGIPKPTEVFEPVTVIPAEDIHVEEPIEMLVGEEPAVPAPVYDEQGECKKGIDFGEEKEVPAELRPGAVVFESEFVDADYAPGEEEPDIIVGQLWSVAVPGADEFYVEAPDEAGAKQMAREELKVDRLPNHTRVSLS